MRQLDSSPELVYLFVGGVENSTPREPISVTRQPLFSIVPILVLLCSPGAFAFRNCAAENSDAFSASTQYIVGEIAFDPDTGWASGTETTYNHSNRGFEGHTECHVTYELSGVFEATSGTLVLDGHRTNHSTSCSTEMIGALYPTERSYAIQIEFIGDGSTRVLFADSGELLARGDWSSGSTAYRTRETCDIF